MFDSDQTKHSLGFHSTDSWRQSCNLGNRKDGCILRYPCDQNKQPTRDDGSYSCDLIKEKILKPTSATSVVVIQRFPTWPIDPSPPMDRHARHIRSPIKFA